MDVITISEAKQLLADGQFGEGSMAPKMRAAIQFVENGGKETIITDSTQLGNPKAGTRIVADVKEEGCHVCGCGAHSHN